VRKTKKPVQLSLETGPVGCYGTRLFSGISLSPPVQRVGARKLNIKSARRQSAAEPLSCQPLGDEGV